MASSSIKSVRILLVGDDGVGKTSLILALVSEEFPDEVPAKAEEITIPADVTPEKVPTHIVDFSTAEQGEDELRDEIQKADVVCVVYAVNYPESIQRITDYWLPVVSDVCGEYGLKPIVLVGNKSDVMETEGATMEEIVKIMDLFPEVETCIECSAKDLKNISELFYYAQKAVLHPTAPLYSNEDKELKPACVKALTRIFTICDLDNDRILNDQELNEFQKRCFKSPLPPQGLQEVKNIVKRNIDRGVNDVGLTLEGFLFLHKLFIQKGRHETTWTALRKFGYGNNLELRNDYVYPKLEVGSGCSVELSAAGTDFFQDLFTKYDKDDDDALSSKELDDMSSNCPERTVTEENLQAVVVNEKGWITSEGFVSHCVLSTYLDYSWTLAHLAYFGYIQGEQETQMTAVRVTRSRKFEVQKKKTNRTVFVCYIFGAPGSGKTAFMQGFLGRSIKDKDPNEVSVQHVCRAVQLKKTEIFLVLNEIFWEDSEKRIQSRKYDAACFLYDVSDPQSFGHVARLRQRVGDDIPCMFIGTKSDLVVTAQDYFVQPVDYSVSNSSLPLQSYSALDLSETDQTIFQKMAVLARHRYMDGPGSDQSLTQVMMTFGLSMAAAVTIAFIAYRYAKKGVSGYWSS